MRRKLGSQLGLLVAVALVLVGCGGTATPTTVPPTAYVITATPGPSPTAKVIEKVVTATPPPAPTAVTGPIKGGTITIVRDQEPDKLVSQWTNLTVSGEVIELLNDPLVRYNEKNELVPFLAMEVPSFDNGGIAKDGKTITWKLRKDVKWSDGVALTSRDVKFTIDTVQDPKNSALAPDSQLLSVETPDDYTVVVTYKVPSSVLATNLAGYSILPEHALKGVTDWKTAAYFGNPVPSCGAFKFVEWKRGSHIMVEKNPDYYKAAVNLDKVIYRIMPNDDARLTALAIGEADVALYVLGEHVPLYRQMKDAKVYETPAYSGFFFEFNLKDPLLKDVRTRQALNYGLDREGIVETIVQGLGSVKWSPLPRPSWAWIDVTHKYPYDPAKAKSLLDAAGWKDTDGDGVREATGVSGVTDGTKLVLSIVNIAGQPERLQICQVAQQQWKELGAKVDINTTEIATYVADKNDWKVSMSYGYRAFTPDPSAATWWYRVEDTSNWHGFSAGSPEVPGLEELIRKGEQSLDLTERKQIYAQFQEMVAEAAVDAYVYDRAFFDVAKLSIQNFKPSPGGVATWNAYEWWIKK